MEHPAFPHRVARGLDRLAFGARGSGPLAALSELGSVVAPSECVCCGAPDTVLCPECRGALRAATVRPFEAQHGAEGLPLMGGGDPLRVVASGVYAREVSAAVLAFKNRQRVRLAAVLGPALAGAIRTAASPCQGPVLLVPIPSSRTARARRGYAPVDMLVRWVAQRGLLPEGVSVSHALRVPPRPPWAATEQKSKGRRARGASAAEMVLRPGAVVAGFTVLLVDDVLTTGSTLARGYRRLEQAGARVHSAAVLAATAPPRREGTSVPPLDAVRGIHDTPVQRRPESRSFPRPRPAM